MTFVQSLTNVGNLKMLSRSMLFPVHFRRITRSCVREKIPGTKSSGQKTLNIETNESLPVETDTEKLAKWVCGSNLFVEGGEDIKLKQDSEYPSWLWEIRSPPPFEELSPKTKTYWNRVRKMREREYKYLLTLQRNKTVHK